ncbi:hypothetical protein M8542_34730 [Amycolatopsis sp. OK19-0408]|uniref:Uncharacterized protein n=1 Tax=Amycolatopsis iheyensis TaxID=2945988 RepID=A0A9X2NHL5_9PSEU|nr:hypothetical protein [Amycolatopsis iheyensis]MCR6487993.1 hypothetical protein [Amycolatopsis iheyensis]
MTGRGVLMAAGWLLAAVATAGVGTVALDVVGAGILGPQNQPLSQDDVARALETVPTGTTPPPPITPASTAPAPRGLTVPGGTLVAKCTGDQVELMSWSPDTGFRADDVSRGPAASASLKFKNGGTENVVIVTCRDGEPHAETAADDSGGGHRGRG